MAQSVIAPDSSVGNSTEEVFKQGKLGLWLPGLKGLVWQSATVRSLWAPEACLFCKPEEAPGLTNERNKSQREKQ